MLRFYRSVLGFCAALFLVAGVSAAMAADRSITQLPNTDLPGGDYSTLKSVTLDACSKACADDNICRAFTYNQKAKWCFLKATAGTGAAFNGATSGKVVMSPTPETISATRQGELPFPPDTLVNEATDFAAGLPKSDPTPKGTTYADLVKAGDAAAASDNSDVALASYRQALGVNANGPAVWSKLADTAISRPDYCWLDEGRLVVVHAGIRSEMLGKDSAAMRDFTVMGQTQGDWAAGYEGVPAVVYGHTPSEIAEWFNNTICLDTGCVAGGRLTALRWPEREVVSVPAGAVYSKPSRPFLKPREERS